MNRDFELLFSQYGKGSFESFAELFESFKTPIYKLSLAKVRSSYESIDILNAVFDRFHLTRSLYIEHFEVSRWLFVLTLSEIHRHLNHSPAVSFEMKSTHDLEKENLDLQFESALKDSLSQLNEEKETELNIRFLDGLAFEEIASRLMILGSNETETPKELWMEDWKFFKKQLEAGGDAKLKMALMLEPQLKSRVQKDLRKRLLFSKKRMIALFVLSALSLFLAHCIF